jgi:hypothetical protein
MQIGPTQQLGGGTSRVKSGAPNNGGMSCQSIGYMGLEQHWSHHIGEGTDKASPKLWVGRCHQNLCHTRHCDYRAASAAWEPMAPICILGASASWRAKSSLMEQTEDLEGIIDALLL